MAAKKKTRDTPIGEPALRVKVRIGSDAIGPGKIALLLAIDEGGGISQAARAMGMSYRRAWHLINTLQSALGREVVETTIGGEGGGGAKLTPFGHDLTERYSAMIRDVDAAGSEFLAWLGEGGERNR